MVLSVRSGAASRVVSMVTSTFLRSWLMSTDLTVPIGTSLYLSGDWPGTSPLPVSNSTTIVGPRLEKVSHASQPPIRAVSSGTIQISGMRRERRTEAVGTGAGLSSILIPIAMPPHTQFLSATLSQRHCGGQPTSNLPSHSYGEESYGASVASRAWAASRTGALAAP